MNDQRIQRLAALEEKCRADETDWESFFEAAELWEEILAEVWHGKTEEERAWSRYQTRRLIEGRMEALKPGPWKRLWNTITRKG